MDRIRRSNAEARQAREKIEAVGREPRPPDTIYLSGVQDT